MYFKKNNLVCLVNLEFLERFLTVYAEIALIKFNCASRRVLLISLSLCSTANSYYPIYAEVLYNFTAAGPQELGLERGTMIEILRKEVGPWWFGRIKKEDASLVEEILDPELGWFPKDFVRIIHSPETDAFFNLHKTEEAKEELVEVNENQVPVPIAELNSSCEQQEDANSTMTVDQSNITTIVIESPPAPSTSSAAAEAEEAAATTSARINVQLDNCDILRRNAVRELLETEVNYVKLLAAICEG